MAGLLIVAVIAAGLFWMSTRWVTGDPSNQPTPSATLNPGLVAPTPIAPQRIRQVEQDLKKTVEEAQERLNQAQQQLEPGASPPP